MAERLVYRPEDQVFTLANVAAKEGEPIVLGEHDEILSASYDSPMFYLVVRVPWDAQRDGSDFYEEDEAPAKIKAGFDAAEKGVTRQRGIEVGDQSNVRIEGCTRDDGGGADG